MKIGDICSPDVVFVRPHDSALDAARLMREMHVGDVVVVEEHGAARYPIGIITDRDLTIEIMAKSVNPESVTVGDMSAAQQLTTARADDDVFLGLQRMRARGVRRMPVVDQAGAITGIVTMDDILDLLSKQISDLVQLVSREYQQESRTRKP
jgi:CBS domain-containing protein